MPIALTATMLLLLLFPAMSLAFKDGGNTINPGNSNDCSLRAIRTVSNETRPAFIANAWVTQPEFPQDERGESTPELDELPWEGEGSTGDTGSTTGDDENSGLGAGEPVPGTGVVSNVGGWLNSFWVLMMFIGLYMVLILICWLTLRLPRPEVESGFPFEATLEEMPPTSGTTNRPVPPPVG